MADLYDLPNGWEWKKLGDIAEYINGMAFKPKDWFDTGLPIIRIQNLNGSNDYNYFNGEAKDKYYVKDGDILISWSASLDVYKWNRGDAILNQHIFNTNIKFDAVDYNFFYHTIKYSLTEIIKNLHGVGIKHITKGKFENIDIPLPPLSEQQRIVSKLDNLFEKIDKAIALHQKNMNEANLFMGSVLNDVFTELEKKYKKIDFNSVCNKITDGSHNPPKGVKNSEYLMLSSKNVINNTINFENPRYLKEEDFNRENKRTDVMVGDVLLTIVGTIGRTVVVETDKKFVLQRSVAVLKPKSDLLNSYFLMYSLRKNLNILLSGAKGAAQKGIYLKSIKQLEIVAVPLETQQKIVKYLDEVSKKTEKVKSIQKVKMDNLKALKASILDKAFRGEL